MQVNHISSSIRSGPLKLALLSFLSEMDSPLFTCNSKCCHKRQVEEDVLEFHVVVEMLVECLEAPLKINLEWGNADNFTQDTLALAIDTLTPLSFSPTLFSQIYVI